MEKREGSKPKEPAPEDLQIQEQKVDLDYVQVQEPNSQREQEIKNVVANFFSKQFQPNFQKSEISHQKETLSFDNSEVEPLQLEETVTYGKPENDWSDCSRVLKENLTKCHPESADGVRARSQELKQDANKCHLETKETEKLENGETLPVSVQGAEPERPQPSKGYVILPVSKCDAKPERPQSSKDYATLLGQDPFATARSAKTKDYVTFRPRRPDDITEYTEISRGSSRYSKSKDYVTKKPPVQIPETPTHIFWPVRQFQKETPGPESSRHVPKPSRYLKETASAPKSPIQVHVPTRSLQEPSSPPESEVRPRVPLQQLKEKRKSSSSVPSRKRPQHVQILQSQRLCSVPEEDDFPLVPFQEVCPETAVETNEPGVQRSRILGALMNPLTTGVQYFVQRFYGRQTPSERQASFKKLSTGCMILFHCLLVAGIVTPLLYFCISADSKVNSNVKRKFDNGRSNVTSLMYDSRLNLSIPETDVKQYRQSESLYDKVNIPGTPLAIMDNSDVNFTIPVADFEVNLTNSLGDLDSGISFAMNSLNDKVNTLKNNTESNMDTLVTDLNVNLIGLGVTTPVNDFDVNVITPKTDLDFNVFNPFNPVTDMDVSITIPVVDFNVNFTTCATF